jgi:hypothetical protein
MSNNEKYVQTRFRELPNRELKEFVPKPRIGYYKARLSYKEPDLEKIVDEFIYWSQFDEYLVFRKEHTLGKTFEIKFKAVKASKRGNDVYSWKLKKRLNALYNLPKIEFFNFKDRNRRQRTRAIFVTLTYRRDIRIDEAWDLIGADYNRWITHMRKDFGKIDVIRCWEAHEDGYPHIHCVLVFHDEEFETYHHQGKKGPKWLVSRKRELEKYWVWGFSDMWAMYSLGAGYVLKYVTKVNDCLLVEKPKHNDVLSLALMWIFRKRAFSVSKGFGLYFVKEGKRKVLARAPRVVIEPTDD